MRSAHNQKCVRGQTDKIGPHESRLGPNVMGGRSAETKMIRARGEEDRTLWGDGPRERKRLGVWRVDIESSHLHAVEKDPLRSTVLARHKKGPFATSRGPFGTETSLRAKQNGPLMEIKVSTRSEPVQKSPLESLRLKTVRVWGLRSPAH